MDLTKHLLALISLVLSKFGYMVSLNTGMRKISTNQLTIEIPLTSSGTTYLLNQYQRLNGTLLKQIVVPYDIDLTTGWTNATIASKPCYYNAYLNLLNTRSEKIVDNVPLYDYIRDNTFQPGKGLFNELDIDWTKSFIFYPNTAIIAGDTGNIVQVVVFYEDLPEPKRN